jgi:hypothetical protein
MPGIRGKDLSNNTGSFEWVSPLFLDIFIDHRHKKPGFLGQVNNKGYTIIESSGPGIIYSSFTPLYFSKYAATQAGYFSWSMELWGNGMNLF